MVELIKAILFGVGAACNFADIEVAADPEAADLEVADPEPADPEADDPGVADPEGADPKVADPKVADPEAADPADKVEAAEAPKAWGVGGEIDVDEGEDTPPPLIKVVLVL